MHPKHFLPAALAFAAFGVGLMTSSCASAGAPIDMAKVAQIQKGVTTRTQVEQMLGPPVSATTLPDGQTACLWVYTKASNHAQNFVPVVGAIQSKIDIQSDMLQILFTPEGIAQSITKNQTAMQSRGGLIN